MTGNIRLTQSRGSCPGELDSCRSSCCQSLPCTCWRSAGDGNIRCSRVAEVSIGKIRSLKLRPRQDSVGEDGALRMTVTRMKQAGRGKEEGEEEIGGEIRGGGEWRGSEGKERGA
eukprot:752906-Hanusia_phi.AAC.6